MNRVKHTAVATLLACYAIVVGCSQRVESAAEQSSDEPAAVHVLSVHAADGKPGGEPPMVVLRYSNNHPTDSVVVTVPVDDEEMYFFDGLLLTVDGETASYRYYDPEIDDPAYSHYQEIGPAAQFDLVVDTALLFELPAEWKRIEVRPGKFADWRAVGGEPLVIEREQ